VVGKERVLEVLETGLRAFDGDQAEVRVTAGDEGFTRYANSEVTQSSVERNAGIMVRVIRGKKTGSGFTTSLDRQSVERVARQASQNARFAPDNTDLVPFPGPRPLTQVRAYFESTAQAGPAYRADNVREVVGTAARSAFQAAGVCATHVLETAIANSLGVRAYQAQTWVRLTCIVTSREGSGYADGFRLDASEIDPGKVAAEAVSRCALNRDQVALESGEYTVILEPYAVWDIIVSVVGAFNGHRAELAESFLWGNLGKRIFSENLTVWDDGLDPTGFPSSFDYEGQPKSKVVLIDKGIALNLVHDSASAAKRGLESTGHSGGCLNLFVGEGSMSRDELIASTPRALLITRFHYVRAVDPQRAIITGMTRDGTFLIEDGKITRAVSDMRFNQSVIEALSHVDVSRERQLIPPFPYDLNRGALLPAMRIGRFLFTSRADH
jgi:predicted Zn-dependent protease